MGPVNLLAYDAYLFDIDGTLLTSADAVHYFAFCEALGELAGRPLNLDGVIAHGNVDVGILRDALSLAGIPEAHWRPRLPAACAGMCRFVSARTDHLSITVLPGVRELLGYLRGQGKVLGVATGNLEGIGRAKLHVAGLLNSFDFGGYSDRCEYRHEVFAAALTQARTLTHPGAAVCVVGDTPQDVRAAKANGLDVIAVGTGIYSLEELQEEQPTFAVDSLTRLLEPQGAMQVQPQTPARSDLATPLHPQPNSNLRSLQLAHTLSKNPRV